jgi:peptide/nickel transport system substrate-binding protein
MNWVGTSRWIIMLAALALVLTACPADDGATPDPAGDPDAGGPPDLAGEFGTYTTGIFEDITTDNVWSHLDSPSAWTEYVLGPTRCALYDITLPAVQVTPDVAAEDVPMAEEVSGVWQVEVSLRDDVVWSDGTPLTAHDLAFAYGVAREFELGGNWGYAFPEVVADVEASGDHVVRISFSERPGLGVWPNRTAVAGVFMPEHFWTETVEQARAAGDPAVLLGASGVGDPSCGPTVLEEWEQGAFARVAANPNYHLRGAHVVQYGNGAVLIDGETYGPGPEGEPITEYTVGPYFDDMLFTLYGAQDTAMLALRQGEVDFLFNPLGLERGLQEPVIEDPDLEIAVNPSYGMNYLAFNFRKEPMNDKAFRHALATMIDREFMADTVLGGVAFPLFTMLPTSNVAWFNEAVADDLYSPYQGLPETARLEAAVEILRDAGYSWEQEPAVDEEGAPVAGSGMRMPNGDPVPELVLNSLSAGYDPLRATYGLWIERWGQSLGIPMRTQLSGFGPLIDLAFPAEGAPEFDMYILGWGLEDPAFPGWYETFWHSRNAVELGGFNSPGFDHPEFDAAVDAFLGAQSFDEAYDLLWTRIEPILADEMPYVALYDTPLVEGYRHAAIRFPFTDAVGGIQFGSGYPSLVTGAR